MDRPPSKFVQHGLHSWVDYDKPWFANRLLLLREYQTDTLRTLSVALIVLTIFGTWYIIGAFMTWFGEQIDKEMKPQCKCDSQPQDSTEKNPNSEDKKQSELLATEKNSEAAPLEPEPGWTDVTEVSGDRLKAIAESTASTSTGSTGTTTKGQASVSTRPKGHRRALLAILRVTVLLALLSFYAGVLVFQLIEITIFSWILGDSLALSTSPDCVRFTGIDLPMADGSYLGDMKDQVENYREKCYQSSAAPIDCWPYITRKFNYLEEKEPSCPFQHEKCAYPGVLFDTGYADAKYIGLNHPEKFYLRKRLSCSQLRVGQSMKPEMQKFLDRPYPQAVGIEDMDVWEPLLPPAFENCSVIDVSSRIWDHRDSPDGHQRKPDSTNMYITMNCPQETFSDEFKSNAIGPDNFVSLEITTQQCWRDSSAWRCEGISTPLTYMACAADTHFCDLKGSCWRPPILDFKHVPDIFHGLEGDRKDGLAKTLLNAVLANTIYGLYRNEDRKRVFMHSKWRDMVRKEWETSLVKAQTTPVNIVRGYGGPWLENDNDLSEELVIRIPDEYKEVCQMIKFRSDGRRNLNVWGLLAFLVVASLTIIGARRTDDNMNYAIVAVRSALDWCF